MDNHVQVKFTKNLASCYVGRFITKTLFLIVIIPRTKLEQRDFSFNDVYLYLH